MNATQQSVVLFFGLIAFYGFVRGAYEVFKKQNPFGEPFVLFWLGIFVWGDALLFGFFWSLVTIFCTWQSNWQLFLLIFSIFWVVRSLGEVLYWIGQQFSSVDRNPPERLLGYRFFKNDSLWFVYQIIWQCILVISIVSSIYLSSRL